MSYTIQNMHTSKIHGTVFLNTSGVVRRIFILFDNYFFTTCHVAYVMKGNLLPSCPPPHTNCHQKLVSVCIISSV